MMRIPDYFFEGNSMKRKYEPAPYKPTYADAACAYQASACISLPHEKDF